MFIYAAIPVLRTAYDEGGVDFTPGAEGGLMSENPNEQCFPKHCRQLFFLVLLLIVAFGLVLFLLWFPLLTMASTAVIFDYYTETFRTNGKKKHISESLSKGILGDIVDKWLQDEEK